MWFKQTAFFVLYPHTHIYMKATFYSIIYIENIKPPKQDKRDNKLEIDLHFEIQGITVKDNRCGTQQRIFSIFFSQWLSKNAVYVSITYGMAIFLIYSLENKIILSFSARHCLHSPGHKFYRPLHHFLFSRNEA